MTASSDVSLDSTALLDACVLAPFAVCDLFLRLAEELRLYRPRWSDEILAEVRRTQIEKLGWPENLADYWNEQVRASFPEALVTGYEALMEQCLNHEKDRHVLAAAIKAGARFIVTSNLRDFPSSALNPHSVSALHPSEFLSRLYDMDSSAVLSRIDDIAAKRGISREVVLQRLHKSLPGFVQHIRAQPSR